MEHKKSLRPLEFRVIKLDQYSVLDLLRKILNKICFDQLNLFGDITCVDSVSVGQYFDETSCEILLFAYICKNNLSEDSIIPHIKNLAIVAQDSILTNVDGWPHYNSFQISSEVLDQPQEKTESICVMPSASNGFSTWQSYEVRIIRLSQKAIGEVLWEYFMETGHELMNIPQENLDDSPTIYRMYTGKNLKTLTLYVMNLYEASDNTFKKIDAYCDSHIGFASDSSISTRTDKIHYVTGFLSKL